MQTDPRVWSLQKEISKYLSVNKRYILAVSGGADSMALLDAAAEVFAEALNNLCVCHIEHGIRGEEALRDAELVRSFCQKLGANFVCVHVEVPQYADEQGLSLEEAARELRYKALCRVARDFKAEAIAVAHHADDQAETVLWKLIRGAGSDGISGMSVISAYEDQVVIRPLLKVSRQIMEQYCLLRNIKYCVDSTNDDVTYTRNRIRKELLPYLEKNYNPAVKETLIREAQILAEERELLEALTESYTNNKRLFGEIKTDATSEKGFWLDARALSQQAPALRKRILRKAYFLVGGKELSYERTAALEKLCLSHTGGKVVQLPENILAMYKNKQILIFRGEKNA